MSKPWTERHGGIWLNKASTVDQLVVEEYDSERDSFTLIWQRASDGHFQIEYLVKGNASSDPQWSLPFWENIAGQGIYGTLSDAQADLKAIVSGYRQRAIDT
ncbi:hypothetical protein AAKU61_001426 [Undibacterium sp. GrIS 1.2]|uniref:hypothetical protein n=1 Tax=Undibacterium sp. GrIS 1.2 TaxID=3143933 RepID=UPI003399C466